MAEKLGFDLWIHILSYINDDQQIFRLRSLNRIFSQLAYGVMYRKPRFETTLNWAQYMIRILSNPILGSKLRFLDLQVEYPSELAWKEIIDVNTSEVRDRDFNRLRTPEGSNISMIHRHLRESIVIGNLDIEGPELEELYYRINEHMETESIQDCLQNLLAQMKCSAKRHSTMWLPAFEQILLNALRHPRMASLMPLLCKELQLQPLQVFQRLLIYCQNLIKCQLRYKGKNLNQIQLLSSALIQVFKMSPNLQSLCLCNQEIIPDELVVETGEYLRLMDYQLNRSDYEIENCGVEQVFEHLFELCPKLMHLDLSFTSWVTGAVLKTIVRKGSNLRTLNLVGCSGIPPGLAKRFQDESFNLLRAAVLELR